MSKRSLKASPAGVIQARKAFSRKGWTQDQLASEVNLKTRQPIWRFFTSKPIERHTFIEICNLLELNWREIAENPPAEILEQSSDFTEEIKNQDINILVQKVRSKRHEKIQDRCGTLTLLDMNRPVHLDNIYVDVDLLQDIANKQWIDIDQLKNPTSEEFDRLGLGDIYEKRISSLQAIKTYSKLRVLGKPGSGKTTFLQHLAIQCNRGQFAANRVPVFINLRDFADESSEEKNFSLYNYINAEFLTSDITNPTILMTLLHTGRILLLLDGLDEVSTEDTQKVVKEIRRFSEKYQNNLFVVSCRIAVKELRIRGFTDVEIAPFTEEKIINFAQKWFVTFTKTDVSDDLKQAAKFTEQINKPENLHFRQLVVRPLFLHLACWMFGYHEKFPIKKNEFYKQCLDLLLGKWDETKGIERDEIYQDFLLPQKLKFFSQLAAETFEHGKYFFEKNWLQQYINDYLRDLPNSSTETEELLLDSEAVLKAIELQHGILVERFNGIFSFSFLAFQEYFTARKIVAGYNLRAVEQDLQNLVSHLTEPRWREVFLLTASMLRSADTFMELIKQQIDQIVSEDAYLQKFLTWISQKSIDVTSPSLEATRAFYFGLTQVPRLAQNFSLAGTLDQGIFLDALLDDLISKCQLESANNIPTCREALDNVVTVVIDVGFKYSLQKLKDKLPDLLPNPSKSQAWLQTNYTVWMEELREKIIQYRNLKQDWNLSPQQQQTLECYYKANQLLLDCLNSTCEVTEAVRLEIQASLLLSTVELDQREWS